MSDVFILSGYENIQFRQVCQFDDKQLAILIRAALVEFGADRPGFAWQDPELDFMSQAFDVFGRIYYVAVEDEKVLGGGGIAPLIGVDGTCELQKMYFHPSARRKGLGMQLMLKLFEYCLIMGYKRIYLETFTEMVDAQKLYRGLGFFEIDAPLGCTGHGGCDLWFLKELDILQSDQPFDKEFKALS